MPGHEKIDSITNAPESTSADVERDQRDDRQQGVRHGVLAHHPPRDRPIARPVVM